MSYQNTSNLNEFTDAEIREQLEYLGFKNVSKNKFDQFKSDLEKLIAQEVSVNSTMNNSDFDQSQKQQFNDSRRAVSTSPPRSFNNNDKLSRNKKVSFPDDSHLVNDDYEDNEEDEQDSDQSFASIVTTSSIVDNKIFKRKIVRKTPNQSLVQKKDLIISDMIKENDSEFEDDQDEQLMKLSENFPAVNYPVKSFIRSQSSLSLRSDTSRVSSYLKANPVNKYHEYNKLWSKQKMPGEKKHNDLRWSIREQMLSRDVIVKRQPKNYEPNTYTIPTDKKRQQLRWAVRSALANQY